jgi:hypothetical protein
MPILAWLTLVEGAIHDITLTGNTGLYSSRRNRVPRKISDLACVKISLAGLLNVYTRLM